MFVDSGRHGLSEMKQAELKAMKRYKVLLIILPKGAQKNNFS